MRKLQQMQQKPLHVSVVAKNGRAAMVLHFSVVAGVGGRQPCYISRLPAARGVHLSSQKFT